MATLISKACSRPLEDLERLVDAALYSVLVGNCDAHGKDYSILDTALSMRFGRTYRLPDLGPDDLTGFAEDLSVAPRAVLRRLDRLREHGPEAWDQVLDLPELSSEAAMIESIQAGWDQRMQRLQGGT
jgi:serine/threonine-protein kinase HipA